VVQRQIGIKLAAARKERGFTLQELSELTGLSSSFLSQVERGATTPSIASLYRICSALEIPISQVLLEPRTQVAVVRRGGDQIRIQLNNSSASYRYLSGTFPERTPEALINEFPPGVSASLGLPWRGGVRLRPERRPHFGGGG